MKTFNKILLKLEDVLEDIAEAAYKFIGRLRGIFVEIIDYMESLKKRLK